MELDLKSIETKVRQLDKRTATVRRDVTDLKQSILELEKTINTVVTERKSTLRELSEILNELRDKIKYVTSLTQYPEERRKLREAHVVTSFLRFQDKILILKRSQKVGTHRGLWAGVSGHVHHPKSLREIAEAEIHEETGLLPDQLQFIREGDSITVVEQDHVWVIHPFLFDAATTDIKLDWEHDDYKWISPEDLSKYNYVPALDLALKNVLK
jgi:8-oxo-dGTP pyrophosphatase MutT (NUDIX family)